MAYSSFIFYTHGKNTIITINPMCFCFLIISNCLQLFYLCPGLHSSGVQTLTNVASQLHRSSCNWCEVNDFKADDTKHNAFYRKYFCFEYDCGDWCGIIGKLLVLSSREMARETDFFLLYSIFLYFIYFETSATWNVD